MTPVRAIPALLLSLVVLAPPAAALEFNFNPEPGTSQQAIDGFEDAGALWSAIYDDDVTVNIDIGFRSLRPGVLASTGSQRVTVTYRELVDALTADATSADDAAATAGLPAPPAHDLLLNRTSDSPRGAGSADVFLDDDGDRNNTSIRLTRANAKALGLLPADDPANDASITFSSDFNWDFDPSDGTRANHFAFVLVAAHELGHMLGFTSGVDVLDGNSPPVAGPFSDTVFAYVSSKDVFRYSGGSVARGAGVTDWTADGRDKYFSLDGGTTDLGGFSTGRNFGDGQQASHWKDNRGLGLMDPTVAPGATPSISELDVRLLDVIGWDLTQVPQPGVEADLELSVATRVDVTYEVTVRNLGPDDVTGATVDDVFPPDLSGITWTCTPGPGAVCTASGSGDVHDLVDLPAGASVTYTATGSAASAGANAASVTAPSGVTDPEPGNNGG